MLGIRTRWFGAVMAAITIIATACGGGGDDDASGDIVLRTQGDIEVDADDVADTTTTAAPAAAGAGAAEGDEEAVEPTADATTSTSTTLPQEEQSEGEALFEAVSVFQSCLDAEGYEFIGIPDPTLGDVPQNAQPYIDALIACAARSQVQERLAEADAAQADLTPEEVEEQNRQYVAFRDCMIGRGWNIPDPVPNEYGLLFPGFAAAAAWEGPPGEDIAQTDDVGDCTSEANIDLGEDL
ncbi:MAG: hypothetical protein AAGA90_06480 [Actinomycetota bacterium]